MFQTIYQSWFNHQVSNFCSVPLDPAWGGAVAGHIHQAIHIAGEVEQGLRTCVIRVISGDFWDLMGFYHRKTIGTLGVNGILWDLPSGNQ